MELLTALIEGKPIRKDWWFDNDYLIVKGNELWRHSEGMDPLECTDASIEVLRSIMEDPQDWEIGKKRGEINE